MSIHIEIILKYCYRNLQLSFFFIIFFLHFSCRSQEQNRYSRISEIPVPQNFVRIEGKNPELDLFFRNFELKTENNSVYLYNGKLKSNQDAQFAVLKIDVGNRDLQQCADAVMRLRAEFLYSRKKFSQIKFNFLSDGKPRYYKDFAKNDYSYKKFRKYMDFVFSYANTSSLKDELENVSDPRTISIGDIFITKGTPYGHAVTVMDIAKNQQTGAIIFLLSQSYMPAQEIHILKNPENSDISPWYSLKLSGELQTPEWTFEMTDLMRFPE